MAVRNTGVEWPAQAARWTEYEKEVWEMMVSKAIAWVENAVGDVKAATQLRERALGGVSKEDDPEMIK